MPLFTFGGRLEQSSKSIIASSRIGNIWGFIGIGPKKLSSGLAISNLEFRFEGSRSLGSNWECQPHVRVEAFFRFLSVAMLKS